MEVGKLRGFLMHGSDTPILLVEDDDGLRRSLSVCLRIAGYQVETAADERSALARFANRRPAAVISDLILPEGEGLHTLSAMRQAAPDMPIVIMSGGGMLAASHLLGMASSLGASATLAKPFRPAALVNVLETVL
jgi:DNA-binding NtrC family response regulator